VGDMNSILFSVDRSTQGGTQTTHGISIRRLDLSVDGFEVRLFYFFCCFQKPFANAAEIKKFKIFNFCSICKEILKTTKKVK